MRRRTTFVQLLTFFWASLQLVTPGLSAIADGQLAVENATTHIEATTSSSCPVAHSPDCAVCRYLSTSATDDAAPPAIQWPGVSRCAVVRTAANGAYGAAIARPRSRAPPTT